LELATVVRVARVEFLASQRDFDRSIQLPFDEVDLGQGVQIRIARVAVGDHLREFQRSIDLESALDGKPSGIVGD
jgi:hypothetical protein